MAPERRKYILLIMFFIVLALGGISLFLISRRGTGTDVSVSAPGTCIPNTVVCATDPGWSSKFGGDGGRVGFGAVCNSDGVSLKSGTYFNYDACAAQIPYADGTACQSARFSPGEGSKGDFVGCRGTQNVFCAVDGRVYCPTTGATSSTMYNYGGLGCDPNGSAGCTCTNRAQVGQAAEGVYRTYADAGNDSCARARSFPPSSGGTTQPPVVNPPTNPPVQTTCPDPDGAGGQAPNTCYAGGARNPNGTYACSADEWVQGFYDCNTTTQPPVTDPPVVVEPEPQLSVCGQKCETTSDCAGSTQNNVTVECRDVGGTKRCVNTQCPNATIYGTLCQCTTKTDICGGACGSIECKYPLRCTFTKKSQCEQSGATTYCVPPGTSGYGRGPITDSWYPDSDAQFERRKCSNSNNNYLYHPVSPTKNWSQQEIKDYICTAREIPQQCGDGEISGTEECDASSGINTCGANSTCNANTCTCEENVEPEPVINPTCSEVCDPANDTCTDGSVCDASINRCTIPQCVGGGDGCSEDRCSLALPTACGAECNPLINPDQCTDALGSNYSCDSDTNTCKLNSCIATGGCTDGGCTLPYCGDGVCQTGETCEVANPGSTSPIYGTCSTVNTNPGAPSLQTCREIQTAYTAPDGDSCSYCGDGVLNSAYEQCDFNDPTATNCNTSCQTVTPVCQQLVSADGDSIIGDQESVAFTFTYTNVNEGDPYPNIVLVVHDGTSTTLGTYFGADSNNTTSNTVSPYSKPSATSSETTKTYRFDWVAIQTDGVTPVPDGTYTVSVLLDSTDIPGSLVTTPVGCLGTIQVDTAEVAEAAFTVTKSASHVCQASGDAQIDYTITVTNTGEATGTLSSLTDDIDTTVFNSGIVPFNISGSGSYAGGTITWNPAGIGEDSYTAGQSRQYTFSITIPEDELLNYRYIGVDNTVTATDSNANVSEFLTNTVMDCAEPDIVTPVVIPYTGILDDEVRYILLGSLLILSGLVVLRFNIGRRHSQKLVRAMYYNSPFATYEQKVDYENEKSTRY